jgi:valyl-tRNA synthetase
VFHEVVKGAFWHFRYPVVDPQAGEPTHVTIATTRPETMLGDTAVAVHPDPGGALEKAAANLRDKLSAAPQKEKDAVQAQFDAIVARRKTHLPELLKLRDMALAGRMLELPLTGRQIPLIADEWAKPELGSGCVKITPAHDENDYQVGQRHPEIDAINIMQPDGTLNENVPETYRGLSMKQARKQVVADLEAAGLHDPETDVEDREIDLAHSDRSKTPIEPYLADQWFVRMDELAQTAMDAVESGRVKIFPQRYAKGYLDWLSEKRDWPVGRQLWWGHQIPVWTRRFTSMEERNEVQRAASKICEDDLESGDPSCAFWHEWDPDTFEGVAYICLREQDSALVPTVEAAGFVRETDVLDTWFSSALWPHSTLGWPEQTPELETFYPTSTLITSRDIITLWVARMVLMGEYNMRDVPFREVYIHPKILDGYGEGMSKSKGNGVDPLDVIEKFGADALRFGIAHLTTETQDVRMPVEFECPHCQAVVQQTKKNRILPTVDCPQCNGKFSTQWATKEDDKAAPRAAVISERFELGRNFCNKLWNASRFSLMNLEGYTAGVVADDELMLEDRWVLSRLATVTGAVTESLETYHYADAARTLYDFAWDEFCSFYVEMLKERFADETTRPAAQRVLAHTLDVLLRLLHPMIPFLTEEVWQLLGQVAPERGLSELSPACESIMIAPWPVPDAARQDAEIENRFAQFQAVLGGLRELRSRQNIPPREPITFVARCDAERATLLAPLEAYFQSMAGAQATEWGEEVAPPEVSAGFSLPGIEFFVDTSRFIDVAAEIARNEKEEQKLVGFIAGKEKKLSNDSFVSRAPAEVVEKERSALAQLQNDLVSLRTTLEKLRQQAK